jgi:FdhD protein
MSSSCGLCGRTTVETVRRRWPAVARGGSVAARVLSALPDRLRAAQEAFGRTGGLHAAGIFTTSGRLVVSREDVGRHNAVDKVMGYGLLRRGRPFSRHVLLVSGRLSFEIMQKALAGRVPIVAAISAPSSLAVDFARGSGQTIVGFLRGETMNIYTHAGRVRAEGG